MVKRQQNKRRVTLQDLPPELLANIVDVVEQLHAEATERLAAGLAGVPGALGGAEDDDPIMGPGALWAAALGGLMNAVGGGPQAAGGAPAAGVPGAAPAPPAAQQPAGANPPPPAAANTNTNTNAAPPLNPTAPVFRFGAAPAPTPATSIGQAPPVAAPALGSFTFGAPANTTPAAGQGANPTTSPLGFNFSLPPFAPAPAANNSGNLSDDEMPPLETISDDGRPQASTSAAPTPSTSNAPGPSPSSAPQAANSDDEMPPLESISDDEPSTSTTAAAHPASASTSRATNTTSDDEMPPLEALSDDELPAPRASTSTSATRPSAAAAAANSDDEMPPLETISDDESSPQAATAQPSAGAVPRATESDDEMPPLEIIPDDDSPSTTAAALDPPSPTVLPVPSPTVLPVPSPTVLPMPRSSSIGSMPPLEALSDGEQADGEDDEEDYETTEDDEDDYDTYDDEYDEDEEEDSDDEAIFPDGLPLDPLLPLLHLSRPFLHAARKKLYRRITLVSVWQASLLLRSLNAPQHAARNAIEDVEDPDGEKNHLAALVRAMSIDARGDMSIGRGGAEVYFELLHLCKNLDELRILPSLLKSATKPFLAALASLHKLKKVDLASGTDPDKPFLLTTARIIRLMRDSWPELEELVLVGLKSSDIGPMSEAALMWDEDAVDDLCEDAHKAVHGDHSTRAGRPKGLKTLKLLDPDAFEDELSIILKHSAKSLDKLQVSRPSQGLSRWGLAAIFLNFGSNLTSVVLDCPGSWQPLPKTTIKRAFPYKRKDYKSGAPLAKDLEGISRHTFFLDALVPYLPHLVDLTWTGPIASTSAFSFFPPSLKTINWSRSPDIKPLALARLFRKSVTRSKVFTNADGSKTTKQIQTIVSKGLQCVTVLHDDLSWTDADLEALEGAAFERGMCLHLSGGTGAMPPGLGGLGFPMNPFFPAPAAAAPAAPTAPAAAAPNAGAGAGNGLGGQQAGGLPGIFGGVANGAGVAANQGPAPAPAPAANGGAAAGGAQGANGAGNGFGGLNMVGLGGLAIPITLPFGFRPPPPTTG